MMILIAQITSLFTVSGLAAAGAMTVAIPIAIHLLTRLRRRPQPWAAMRFLFEAYKKQRQRMQIEQWLLLLVRCLILLVLGLALSGPLLNGCARAFGADMTGRTVCIVIDDALSTRAAFSSTGTRFEELRSQALRLIEHLRPTDRISLFRAARPVRAEIAPPTLDHDQARQTLAAMEPRFSAADWPAALASVGDLLSKQNVTQDRGLVVMLSDFAAGTIDLDHTPEGAALSDRARILVTRPMSEASNRQIASLVPRRQMVVTGGGAASIPVELKLRRFAPQTVTELTVVDVALLADDAEKPITSLQREHRWSSGQTEATLSFDVPVPRIDKPLTGGTQMILRARIAAGQQRDAIDADDQRQAVVELRSQLHVGVVGHGRSDVRSTGELAPEEWLALALQPGGKKNSAGPIETQQILNANLDEQTLASLDAVFVLSPDALDDRGWTALHRFANGGGLVWICLPTNQSLTWSGELKKNFGLEWMLGVEVTEAPEAMPWTLRLDTPAPEPLSLLAADWSALLKPVRIKRRVDINGVTGDSSWAQIASSADGKTPASPWLVSAPVGDGRVILITTAVDTAWSNLPTQPIFVPLLHETLRGVLGSSGDAGRLTKLTAGDRPLLGRRWDGVQQLVAAESTAIVLRRNDAGLEPAEVLEKPAVYTAQPGIGLKLAVNPAAEAGNTQALDSDALARWLGRLGSWSWLESSRPEAALLAEAPRTDLGWPLLWATLALLLFETALAKRFSHAAA